MFGNTKSPEVLVTAGDEWVPLDSLINVTVAPGTTAPWTSFTVPETVAVTPCASAGLATAINRHAVISAARVLLQTSPCDMTAPPLMARDDGRTRPRRMRGLDYRQAMLCCQYMLLIVLTCI